MTWHLLIDYDGPEQVPGAMTWPVGSTSPRVENPDPAKWREVIAARLVRAGYAVTASCFEASTNGWHGKLELDPAPGSPMEIVALQAVCGSDPLRESCNVQRAREVQSMGAYAARVLLREVGPIAAVHPSGEIVLAFLRGRLAGPDSFFLDRWNTLYKPNPARRRGEAPKP